VTLLLIAWGVMFALSGDYLLKTSAGVDVRLFAGVWLYGSSAIPVWLAYRRSGWMDIGLLWSVMALVLCAFVGAAILHEPMTVRKWIAFGMALASMLLWDLS